MRKSRAYVAGALAVLGGCLLMNATAMAEDDKMIAIPYQQEDAWTEIAVTNDGEISTGVNIRSAVDEDSAVIGYLYPQSAAWVIERGDKWTEVYSGGLTGFVKNEYLIFGEDAEAPAQESGVEGVATTWDEVNLYADADGGSEVLDVLDTGEQFVLSEDQGHWLQVQVGADSLAYVSEDDVSRVLLMNTAVPGEGVSVDTEDASDGSEDAGSDGSYTDDSGADAANYDSYAGDDTESYEGYTDAYSYDSGYDDSYGDGYDDSYTDSYDDGYDDSYTDSYDDGYDADYMDSYDDGYDDSYTDSYDDGYDAGYMDGYDSGYTDTASYDAGYSEDVYTEGDGSYYDAETGIYYDASTNLYYDSGTGILYDPYWNPVNEATAVPMNTAAAETYTDDSASYSDGSDTSAGTASTGSSDDTNLLAALIYCEAGNQSYEGMVAVGAVVMNRVYSSSFPNTISEVIYQSGQFTPASSGALASALASGVPSTCYDAAVAALGGENPVGGALYFNTGSGKGTKIGAHQFY